MPLDVCKARGLFQRTMLTYIYIHGLVYISATLESTPQILGANARSAVGCRFEVQFGPQEITNLGHVISGDGILVGEDRVKSIFDPPKPQSLEDLHLSPGHG